MAYVTQKDHAFGGASIWQPLVALKASLAQRLVQYRAYRSTVNELAMLTDRELTDLGIHRADIREIAQDAAVRA
jgi:uncharacterized protein YjiS (DUF1127 family)